MSDVGWGSDHLEPPKQAKSGIPGWLIGCAGGCMFLVGASAVALYYGGRYLQGVLEKNSDPEVQWPALAKVLPHETPPEGFEIVRPIPLIDLWRISSPNEDAVLFVGSAPATGDKGTGGIPAGDILARWYREPGTAPLFGDVGGRMELRPGKIAIQGRELDSLRFHRAGGSAAFDSGRDGTTQPPENLEPLKPSGPPVVPEAPKMPKVPGAGTGARELPQPPEPGTDVPDWLRAISAMHEQPARGDGIAIDVTPEGGEQRVIVWLVRLTPGEIVSDEDAARLLAPFAIGPVR